MSDCDRAIYAKTRKILMMENREKTIIAGDYSKDNCDILDSNSLLIKKGKMNK